MWSALKASAAKKPLAAYTKGRHASDPGAGAGKKKKKGRSMKAAAKGMQAAARLHSHHSVVQGRHEQRRATLHKAEADYLARNAFATSEKTRDMADRRTTLTFQSFTPDMVAELSALAGGGGEMGSDR
jgi:hypothetical protein